MKRSLGSFQNSLMPTTTFKERPLYKFKNIKYVFSLNGASILDSRYAKGHLTLNHTWKIDLSDRFNIWTKY
jgi:hypothetical protein